MKMNQRNGSAWEKEIHMKIYTHIDVYLWPFSLTTTDCKTIGKGGVNKQKYQCH